MKIIAIRGPKDSGKTAAIRHIHQKICFMRNAKVDKYVPAGFDMCDFNSIITLGGKKIVIRSYGDAITDVRSGLKFAKSESADVFITAWNTDLKKNIATELPGSEVIDNPVQICEPLRTQWKEFANMIVQKF